MESIPRTTAVPQHNHKPWHDDEVKDAIKARKRALRAFNSRPTNENFDNFRRIQAQTRRLIRQKKRSTWRQYVSKLNTRTPVSKVWKMVKRIQGKDISSHIQHLKNNDELLSSHDDIANKLAEQFALNSSSNNYLPAFQRIQVQAERKRSKLPI